MIELFNFIYCHFVLLICCVLAIAQSSKLTPIKGPVIVGNLKLSPIGIGTWAWGNRFLWQYEKSDDERLKETFDFVVAKGVNWFDTADSYGTGSLSGRSEELLGSFANENKKKSFFFATKLAPYPWRIGVDSMKGACKSSISRLQRPLDILQLHWPPSLTWQERNYLKSFAQLVADGSATQLGVSNYGPKGLTRVQRILKDYGVQVHSNQVQFSLLSRYPLTSGLLDACKELGVQPIGYSPLALGLLADKYTEDKLPNGIRGILFREFLPIMRPLLGELREIAKTRRKTVSQVVLNWNLQKGLLVLVGARTVKQAEENLGALGWALSAAEVDALDAAAKKVPKQLVQNSFQSS